MEGDRRLSLIVGGFVIASLAAIALVILSLSSETGVFTPQYRLVAYFTNVQGLLPGAPIWLAGKEVGRVESVTLEGGDDRGPLRVVLKVRREVQDRIREDSAATIGTIGLLGDSYVEVTVGSLASPLLRDGAEIQAVDPSNMAEVLVKGAVALDNVAKLAANLNSVVESFAAESGGQKAADAIDAASEIINEVHDGSGLLHAVIYDSYSGGGVESIQSSLSSLESILEEVRQGEGILHALIYDKPTEQDIVMETLAAGARLNSILSKVDRGDGTLGLLLNDPSLYEDMKILIGGAQRSSVVRSLVRMAVEQD